MFENYFALVRWGPRKELLDSCVARAQAFLACAAHCDPIFTRWFDKGRSRRDALKRPITDVTTLRRRFSDHRTDVGRKVMKRLGFSFGMWNGGDDDDGVSLLGNCGSYAEGMYNYVDLHLPQGDLVRARVLSVPVMTQLLECMVNAWDPDHGVVGSSQFDDLRPEYDYASLRIGWLIYISNRMGTVPPLLAPTTITRLGDKGSLITVTPERFTASNPAHVEAADRVAAALKRVGLFKPD